MYSHHQRFGLDPVFMSLMCVCVSVSGLPMWIHFARACRQVGREALAVDPLSSSCRNFLLDPACNQWHPQCPFCQNFSAPPPLRTHTEMQWHLLGHTHGQQGVQLCTRQHSHRNILGKTLTRDHCAKRLSE